MKENNTVKIKAGKPFKVVYFFIAIFTTMVGYEIHHNLFYALVNFIAWPISWLYWLIMHDVDISTIKSAFSFFLK